MGLVLRMLAGFGVAVLCTPAGVSGAFILLPVQIILFGAPSPAVSATNLLFNVTATPSGVISYRRRGALHRSLTVCLVAGSGPGVVLGALARSTILADGDTFGPVAAAVLLGLGARLLLDLRRTEGSRDPSSVPAARLVGVGFAAGIVGGIYGMGGAALVVPWLVSVERLSVRDAAGPGLVVTLTTSLIGLATFTAAAAAGVGEAAAPDWTAGLALGVGGAGGAVVGARLQPRLPIGLLRAIVAIAAIAAGLRLLF
jgi:uncharacterized membrane protein YfcA